MDGSRLFGEGAWFSPRASAVGTARPAHRAAIGSDTVASPYFCRYAGSASARLCQCTAWAKSPTSAQAAANVPRQLGLPHPVALHAQVARSTASCPLRNASTGQAASSHARLLCAMASFG